MLGQPEDNHPEDTDDTYPDYGLQVYDPPQEFKPVPYGTYDTGDRVTVPEDFTGYDDARPGIITYMLGNIKADIVITKEGDRVRQGRRADGLRVQPGLHGLRWLAVRGPCREDLQGRRPCRPKRIAGGRAE